METESYAGPERGRQGSKCSGGERARAACVLHEEALPDRFTGAQGGFTRGRWPSTLKRPLGKEDTNLRKRCSVIHWTFSFHHWGSLFLSERSARAIITNTPDWGLKKQTFTSHSP